MLSGTFKPFLEQFLEVGPAGTVKPTDDVDVIERELEWGSFESHIPSWGIGEHETEIDMNQVTIPIDEDVSIVTVFDLEEVGDYGVS